MGDTLAATWRPRSRPVPVTSLFRFVQVWANVGIRWPVASGCQLRLHAECVRVRTIARRPSADYIGSLVDRARWRAPHVACPSRSICADGVCRFVDLRRIGRSHRMVVDRGGEARASYTSGWSSKPTRAAPGRGAEPGGSGHSRDHRPGRSNRCSPDAVRPRPVDLEWTPPPVGATQMDRIDQPVGPASSAWRPTRGPASDGLHHRPGALQEPIEPRNANGQSAHAGRRGRPAGPVHFVPVTVIGQRRCRESPRPARSIAPPGIPWPLTESRSRSSLCVAVRDLCAPTSTSGPIPDIVPRPVACSVSEDDHRADTEGCV